MEFLYNRFIKYVSLIERFAGWLMTVPEKWLYSAFAFLGVGLLVFNTFFSLTQRVMHGDLVAQQLMILQWTTGTEHVYATAEATNYIIKFPFYWLMEQLIASPLATVITTAIGLNIVGWGLAWLFLYKIISLVGWSTKKTRATLAILMVYVATISDSVYWILFPNSRNLEVALMIAVMYGILWTAKNAKRMKWYNYLLLPTVFGVIFANDLMAMVLIAAPLGLYYVIKLGVSALRRASYTEAVSSIAPLLVIGLSAIFYKLLNRFALSHIFVTPDKAGGAAIPDLASTPETILGLGFSALHQLGVDIFGRPLVAFDTAPYLINWLVLAAIVAAICIALKNVSYRKNGVVQATALTLIFLPVIVFLTGFSSAEGIGIGSARYMIVLPFLVIVLVVGAVRYMRPAVAKKVTLSLMALVMVSTLAFLTAYGRETVYAVRDQAWETRNARVYELIDVMAEHGISKGYSSIQTAQTVTYFTEQKTLMLPVACDTSVEGKPVQYVTDWLIEASTLFEPSGRTAIEVDTVPSKKNLCSLDLVKRQVGVQGLVAEEVINDGHQTVLVYDRDILQSLRPKPQHEYTKR